MRALLIAILAGSGLQDDPAARARALVRQLGSERVEEREEAARELHRMGKAAAAELEKASRDSDIEVAARAREILLRIEVIDRLTPALKAAVPDAEERLTSGQGKSALSILRLAWKWEGQQLGRSHLGWADLEFLLERAWREAEGPEEKKVVCRQLGGRAPRSATRRLLVFLRDPDVYVRRDAMDVLKDRLTREHVPDLLPLLKDKDPGIRRTGLTALRFAKAYDSAREVLPLLEDPDGNVRQDAAMTLTTLGCREALPEIMTLLQDEDPHVRAWTPQAFLAFKAQEPIPVLIGLLKDPHFEVRVGALSALCRLNARSALPAMMEALKDEHPWVRAQAANDLGEMGARKAIPALQPLLEDSEEGVQLRAILALRKLDAREAIPSLRRYLRESRSENRRYALETLGDLGATEAIDDILPFLKHEDENVCWGAINALGCLRVPASARPLLEALQADRGLAGEIRSALTHIGIVEVVPEVVRLLRDPRYKGHAEIILENAPAREAVPELIKLLRDKDADLRDTATRLLGCIRAPGAEADVLSLLRDPDPDLRGRAAFALGCMKRRMALPTLLPLLKDADGGVRKVAAETIGRIESRSVIPHLRPLLEDADASVRDAAREAIVRRAPPRKQEEKPLPRIPDLGTIPEIIPLLAHSNLDVRLRAIRTLGELRAREAVPFLFALRDDMSGDHEKIHPAALEALAKIAPRESVPEFLKILKYEGIGTAALALGRLGVKEAVPDILPVIIHWGWRRDDRPEDALAALEALGGARLGPEIIPSFRSDNPFVRAGAAVAAGHFGIKEARAEVERLLSDRDSQVRASAVLALAKLGGREAIPKIQPFLMDPYEEVRLSAIRGFAGMGGDGIVPLLRPRLKDEVDEVRLAALRELGRLGDRESAAGIASLLEDDFADVRTEAARILGIWGYKEHIARIVPLLRDRDEYVVDAAILALDRLDAKGQAGEIEKTLKRGRSKTFHRTAASALCHMGFRGGVDYLLEEEGALDELNALRAREVWEKLRDKVLAEAMEGKWRDLLEGLARRAGMALEVMEPEEIRDGPGHHDRKRLPGGSLSLMEALREATPRDCSIILETDRIRILPDEEAQEFWERWWEGERGKK